MPRKNVENTYTDEAGKFAAGNPGKPKGARHKTTRAIEELLKGQIHGSAGQAFCFALQQLLNGAGGLMARTFGFAGV
ncbi:MAG: hypothetical protein AAFN80_15540, partial [Pseudomonadota bacterium]